MSVVSNIVTSYGTVYVETGEVLGPYTHVQPHIPPIYMYNVSIYFTPSD